MKHFLTACFFFASIPTPLLAQEVQERPPNIVIMFTDDQGYEDVGVFGATEFATPHLDQMAAEGVRFTDFYVAQAVCGASRAALLTGCYPNRIHIMGAPGPRSRQGIHENEMLISELLKQKDYATGIFGKWHLGDHPKFLPLQHGFDTYYGLPYSNDMWPFHPTSTAFPDLPMIEGDEIINPEVTAEDQTKLTGDYTRRAVEFINDHKEEPFFLYVPHSMPHVPLFAEERFVGSTEQGLYGDVIAEIDWSMGEILKALRENDLDENTLVIFTSDNGPWLSYGDHAGSAAPLREGKGTTWEGGHRVPFIARWPGKIPANSVCNAPAMTIDLMPTLAHLTDTELPDHTIDGKNIWSLFTSPEDAESPQEAYYFYWNNNLHAVRSGKWKLYYPHQYRSLEGEPGNGGTPGPYIQKRTTEFELYDLTDVTEQNDVASDNTEVVARLKELGDTFDADLQANRREPGRITDEKFQERWPES